jgi:uncharacterized protein YqgC (DUF456 family)
MIALVVLGFLLLAAGMVSCVLPILPGPVISYLALIVLCLARGWETFSVPVLIVLGVLAVAVAVLDNVLPVLTARKWGAGKGGIWGSIIGMLAGMFLFPPFGAILGTFAGAVLGELIFGKMKGKALRAGWGVFVGTMLALAVKLAVSGVIAFFYVRAVIRG